MCKSYHATLPGRLVGTEENERGKVATVHGGEPAEVEFVNEPHRCPTSWVTSSMVVLVVVMTQEPRFLCQRVRGTTNRREAILCRGLSGIDVSLLRAVTKGSGPVIVIQLAGSPP